jgi:hypothetical protein
MLNEYKRETNKEIISLTNKLEKRIISMQTKEFPLLRQRYAEIAGKLLWASNIEVYTI